LRLAEERARRVSDLRYEVHFTIPSELNARVEGTVTARFRLTDASRPLAFDFAGPGPVRAENQGRQVPVEAASEHLLIAPAHLREGENAITFRFTAGDAALNRTRIHHTLFSLPAHDWRFMFRSARLKASTRSLDILDVGSACERRRTRARPNLAVSIADRSLRPIFRSLRAALGSRPPSEMRRFHVSSRDGCRQGRP
jgi:hypothetical protein